MSWNDYYRFRYSSVGSAGAPSKLLWLPELFFLLGVPFAIAIHLISGGGDPWSDLNGPTMVAASSVLALWFLATIGELFPRIALWMILATSAAIEAGLAWIWLTPDWLGRSTPSGLVVSLLAAYPLATALLAVERLISRASSGPAA